MFPDPVGMPEEYFERDERDTLLHSCKRKKVDSVPHFLFLSLVFLVLLALQFQFVSFLDALGLQHLFTSEHSSLKTCLELIISLSL